LPKTYTRSVGIEQASENVKELTIIVARIMSGWRFEDFSSTGSHRRHFRSRCGSRTDLGASMSILEEATIAAFAADDGGVQ
jgi:hypothetical protein